jgi:ATP-dependent Clp protease ATP-binding subunit ClpB
MTSNLGSHYIAETAAGETLSEGTRRQVLDALRQHFRPEFLNRVDEIIVFHPLSRGHLTAIVDIQLRGLMKRLADRKIGVELTDRAREFLVKEGYDPVYGARPLKRTIQKRVLDPLAVRVLEGAFAEGDRVVVDRGPDGLTFTREVARDAAPV